MLPLSSRRPARAVLLSALSLAALVAALVALAATGAVAASTASRVCSPNDRGTIWPIKARTGVRRELVPPGATSVTVCRYNGMNPFGGVPDFGLRGAGGSADASAVRRIVRELDALPVRKGAFSCPMDDLSQDVATFSYPSGPSVVVTVGTNGCNGVTNGHVRRLALGAPVVSRITALARPVARQRWATLSGHLKLCGGPGPGRCYVENDGSGDRVLVDGPNGVWLAQGQVVRGRFHFRVAVATPGTYAVRLYSTNHLMGKVRTRLTPGGSATVVFLLSIS